MALTKQRVFDRIEILRDGVVQVRESIEVNDDGELVGQRYVRTVLTPLTDPATITNGRLRQICQVVWTQAVKDAYVAAQAALVQPSGPTFG